MLPFFVVITAIAALFFLIAPGLGAIYVRRRWRIFRKQIYDSSLRPTVHYGEFENADEGFVGMFRFIGVLEAIQGSDTIWMHDGMISASADLKGTTVYILPFAEAEDRSDRIEKNDEGMPDEMLQHLPWSKVSTIPEGTRLIVSGALYSERGRAVFRTDKNTPLTVLLFDGDENTIVRRSIWAGRQLNEYWNQFTLLSLLAGAVALLVIAYYLSRNSLLRLPALFALVTGLTPILPFLPPGIGLFLLYRGLWRRGRIRRAERDLIALPLRFIDKRYDIKSVKLPDQETYEMRILASAEEALSAAPTASIRGVSLVDNAFEAKRYFAFGRPEAGKLGEIADPLVETIIIPGDPWDLSRRSESSARVFELTALLCVAFGYAVNWFVVFISLASWIR